MSTFLILALAAAVSASPAAAPTGGYCYYPGANAAAQNARPCDPLAPVSMCCPIGWTCMSNHICEVTDGSLANAAVGRIQRGTCTSPGWDNETCGNFCLNLPVNENQGDLIPCGDNVFVCAPFAQDGTANCAGKKNVFTLGIGQAQTVIGVSNGVTSTSQIAVSTASGSAPGASSTSVSSSGVPVSPDSKKTNLAPIIGGALGGAAVLIILLIVGFLLRKRRERRGAAARENLRHTERDSTAPTTTTMSPTGLIPVTPVPTTYRNNTTHQPRTPPEPTDDYDDGHVFIPEVEHSTSPAYVGGSGYEGAEYTHGFAGGSMLGERDDFMGSTTPNIPPIPSSYGNPRGNLLDHEMGRQSPARTRTPFE